MRTNRSVRFDFCVATVLVAWRGDPVSCYTTVRASNIQLTGILLTQVCVDTEILLIHGLCEN